MPPLEYISQSLEWWDLYALLAVAAVIAHWLLIRRWTVGIYDPLLLVLLSNAFGWAIVIFMTIRHDIQNVYTGSFLASQLALYLGMELAGRQRPTTCVNRVVHRVKDDPWVPVLIFGTSALAHSVSTLATWTLVGIPLFRASRLGAFQGSGGLGVIERLSDSCALIAAFSLVYLLVFRPKLRRNVFVIAYAIFHLTALALSGSKGALMSAVQIVLSLLFVFTALSGKRDRFWGGRAGKIFLLSAVAFAVIVLTIQEDSDLTLAVLGLVYRIVSYGDVYIYAYLNSTVELIVGDNPVIGMLGGFLSTFRLLPVDSIYPSMGYQLTNLIFPEVDVIVGPNPQHAVFAYHYFGIFGFIFSFFIGCAIRAAQKTFYFGQQRTFVSGLSAFCLYFCIAGLCVDFEYGLSRLASLLIGYCVTVAPALYLRPHAPLALMRNRHLDVN
ncbi:hypothetical protein [Rubrivivax gelatinosus]|uniref:Putative transmembrane protein n=1 Tax=Rubrivivax gelatinosus (strain NBRC 100245 / IL144) TaxID=983917 RepID=I0HWT6_RUBGI|nr:hypothetical protein [Rubrivivax gelatinosus]BAL97473.1 putative transmembrane protein [Rubrivivax gelatinosus IL144]